MPDAALTAPGPAPALASFMRLPSRWLMALAASVWFNVAIAALFLLTSDACWHWLLIPVMACGVLCGVDVVNWLTGKGDTFDPAGLIGLVGVYFFLIAPLLTVSSGHTLRYLVDQPEDYRDWIGGMAVLHVFGLAAYQTTRTWVGARPADGTARAAWRLKARRFLIVFPALLAVTFAAQVGVYALFGGIRGYIEAFTAASIANDTLKGTGWMVTISESFPILALIAIAVALRGRSLGRNIVFVCALLSAFLLLEVLFGGLRGSRSGMVWGLFWGVGIVHVAMRPFSRRFLLAGLPVVLIVAVVWGWYKDAGVNTADMLLDTQTQGRVSWRNWDTLLLSDLSRSDVQALALSRVMDERRPWQPVMGKSYLGALAILVPERIWPSRPPAKIKFATDMEYGPGSFDLGMRTSRVYGLSGEALINFGPLGVPVVFALFGAVVAWVGRAQARWARTRDARLLLAAFLVSLCLLALPYDSENLLFTLVKTGTVPFAAVALSCTRRAVTVSLRAAGVAS